MVQFIPFRKLNTALAFAIVFLLFSFSSIAQTSTSWKGITSTAWATASNWTNGVPTTTSDVIIGDANFTGSFQPTLSAISTINSLTLGGTVNSTLAMSKALTVNANVVINSGSTLSDAGTGSAMTVKGNWTNNGTYTANSSQSVVFGGTSQVISGTATTTFSAVTINAGTTVTMNANISGALTLSGTLVPASTASVTSGSITVSSGGVLKVTAATFAGNYSTITPTLSAGSTVEYSGTSNQTVSNLAYSTLTISGSGVKSLGASLTAINTTNASYGNIYVNAGTLDLLSFTANRASAGGTFSVASGATLKIGGASTGFPSGFSTVSLAAGSTVEYNGTAQTVKATTYGDLILSNSGVKTMSASAMTIAGSLTLSGTASATAAAAISVSGNVTLGSGTALSLGSYTHTVSGNWTNNGATVTPGTSTILLNGTTDQTLGGTASTLTWNSFTVNKSAGLVILGTNLQAAGVVTFTKGTIQTNGNKLILPSGGSITGAGQTTGWVNGNLQKYFSSTSGGTFEIGSASSYLPVVISFPGFTTAGSLVASTTASAHPNVSGSSMASNNISRYWTLSNPASGAIAFTSASITFNWTAADNYTNLTTAILKGATYKSAAWSYPTVSGTPTSTSIQLTGITAVGDFTVGQFCAANFSYSATSFCSNGGTITPTPNTGATTGTFTATPAGLSINSSTGAITLGSSAAGTYTVTNTLTGGCSTSSTATVTVSTMPSATIVYAGSPYCNSGTGNVTFSGTAGGTYSSTAGLSINSTTGAINLTASTANSYTVSYTIAASSGCPQYQATATVHLGPAVWKGTTSTDWATTSNWSCAALPIASNNVLIPAGRTYYPVIASSQSALANDLTLQSGTTLTVNNGTLTIAGAISNSGTLDASNGATIVFSGTAAQTIPASVFANNTVYNLTNSNTVSLTLQGALDITNILSLNSGTLYTNGYLTLKSSATNTARVDQVKSTASSPIVGDVTVERYIPGKRKYRLLTSSVTTSTKTTLATGEEGLSIWGNWQNSGVNTASNTGVFITGGLASDGFDTQTSNTSMYTYNETTKKFVAFSTANGKNTKYTPLTAGKAYYVFVYGDRKNTINAAQPNATVLKAKGTLAVGAQAYSTTSAIPLTGTINNFSLVGNPFACPIDWKSVTKSNVSNTIWGWDSNLGSTGGYVTVTATATGATVSPVSSLVQVSRYVQPGQGFFVQTTGANPQVVINETSKVSSQSLVNSNVFRTTGVNTQPLMAVNLIYTINNAPVLADGAVAAFDASYHAAVTDEDGAKMVNSNDGLSLLENGTLLGINSRPFPQGGDTIQISFSKLTKTQYTLEIFGQSMPSGGAKAFLQDTYLNTITPLSLVDTNRVQFSVLPADAASASANRFRIIFNQVGALPVTFTSVAAIRKDRQVVVEWTVAREDGIKRYEVERSADGMSFSKVGETASRGGSGLLKYQWLDATPATGNNWYRIRSVEGDEKYLYSKAVNAVLSAGKTMIKVAPNPVKNQQIFVQLTEVEKGPLTATLFNLAGNEVLKQVIDHNGGDAAYQIVPHSKLSAGIYYLKLFGRKEEYKIEIVVE